QSLGDDVFRARGLSDRAVLPERDLYQHERRAGQHSDKQPPEAISPIAAMAYSHRQRWHSVHSIPTSLSIKAPDGPVERRALCPLRVINLTWDRLRLGVLRRDSVRRRSGRYRAGVPRRVLWAGRVRARPAGVAGPGRASGMGRRGAVGWRAAARVRGGLAAGSAEQGAAIARDLFLAARGVDQYPEGRV